MDVFVKLSYNVCICVPRFFVRAHWTKQKKGSTTYAILSEMRYGIR